MNAVFHRNQPFDILVTDDDENCRESVCEALVRVGYRAHVTTCGEEAIEYARRHFVHIMIFDFNMPDMTGLEASAIIREELEVTIPSILMSADTSPELPVRARSAHFEDFMRKPVRLERLREIVHQLLLKHYIVD